MSRNLLSVCETKDLHTCPWVSQQSYVKTLSLDICALSQTQIDLGFYSEYLRLDILESNHFHDGADSIIAHGLYILLALPLEGRRRFSFRFQWLGIDELGYFGVSQRGF